MGFFDKLFGGKSKDENTAKFTNQSKTVLTPLQGKVLAQADIPDETFAQGILGPGCGIEPTGDTVYAPFDGVIADLEVKEYNQSSAYKEVCSVIDDATMEIVFNVLETEIAHLKAGMEVEITPYANDKVTLKGTVTEVNPKIDENGMVKVRATTDNPKAVLVDGMNVSILAKRQIADKLIVPKTAVLPRQGRKVVVVYENGRAIWKYVETGFENSREVCIESGLKEGEEAIYENNLGLSHECEVTLINKKE